MSTETPNVVLIVTDQQHIDAVSCHGNFSVRTRSIDRIAARGTSFRQSYCPYPVCGPSRGSILTGRMPTETGAYDNGFNVRSALPNLGQWISRHSSCDTIYSGKWHVRMPHTATIPGFRVIATGVNCKGGFSDPSVTLSSEAFLRNRTEDRPFFLAVMYTQPHDIGSWVRYHRAPQSELRYPEILDELPELPENFRFNFEEPALLERRRENGGNVQWNELDWRYYLWSYYRHVEMVDAEIGRVLRAIEETGRSENTVVIMTSDHGEGMAHHQMTQKHFLYEEAVKVPLIVSWPGVLPEGATNESTLVSGVDLFPTICDFINVPVPDGLRGVSLRPLLEGAGEPPRQFVAIECDRGKGQALRSAGYKYIAYNDDPVELLFDMARDPGETVNLAGDPGYEKVRQEHRRYLDGWLAGLDVAACLPKGSRWPAMTASAGQSLLER